MIKNIPIRIDYYQYCTETWEAIFKEIDFSHINSIIDLCLGWSPKLELALIKTGFEGSVIVVDKSEINLEYFNLLLEPFSKKFKVTPVCLDILNMRQLDKKKLKGDLILANHIIDDLILNYFLKEPDKEKDVFENMELMRQTWDKILSQNGLIEEVYSKFKEVLLTITKKDSCVLIAQYPGYQENLYGLNKAYEVCFELLIKLKKDLIRSKLYNDEEKTITPAFAKLKNPYFPERNIICIKRT